VRATDDALVVDVAGCVGNAAATLIGDDQDLAVRGGVRLVRELQVVGVLEVGLLTRTACGGTSIGAGEVGDDLRDADLPSLSSRPVLTMNVEFRAATYIVSPSWEKNTSCGRHRPHALLGAASSFGLQPVALNWLYGTSALLLPRFGAAGRFITMHWKLASAGHLPVSS